MSDSVNGGEAPLLRVSELSCRIDAAVVLDDLSFALEPGERVAIWGASGSGKSTLLRCLIGLPAPGSHLMGTWQWRDGRAGNFADPSALAPLRGRAIAYVSQSAASSLDPVRTLGAQLAEVITIHSAPSSPAQLLARVRLAESALELYPAQLSGGMAQRAAIAVALAASPDLLLADEPTAAMDNVLARQVLDDLRAACDASDVALILVSHDLALVARHCQRALVLVDGKLIADETIASLIATDHERLAPLVRANLRREDAPA